MPTNRKRSRRTQDAIRITPAAVAAFKRKDGFALAGELRLPPWWPSPLDTRHDDVPEWAIGTPYGNAWDAVRGIRLTLEEAAA